MFQSAATDIVPNDTNAAWDVFVRDLASETTERVSVGPSGSQVSGYSFRPAISARGQFVAFSSYARDLVPGDSNGMADVFVRDLRTGRTSLRSLTSSGGSADAACGFPSISEGAGRVVFVSAADNLVASDANQKFDVFVRD